ncbi:hypothetical protein [Streptomyces sp. NPDC001678]|uniref:hypothetical protein n=1 Tax=Streptomyces sp. NPDC001678 TaxID=3364599 RepID=UPI00368DF1C2
MPKIVVREADTVTLTLTPPAVFTPPPTPFFIPLGTAGFRVERRFACVPEDIELWVFPPIGYSVPPAFPTAGTGRVQLKVPAANRAKYARTSQGVKEVVVNGGPLDLVFTVLAPASNPTATDTTPTYQGRATLTCPRVRPVTAG